MTRNLYLKTYGCQMNVYDSVRIADVLAPQGFAQTDAMDDAELVILNTCHIREKAAEKVYSELGRIRKIKDKRAQAGKQTVIAVAGCVAQAEGDQIISRAPYVDMVVGPQAYQRLPEMVSHALDGQGNVVALDFAADEKFDRLPEDSKPQGTSAFLTIQEGCDKFCTFCVVPYTRGAEYSRPVNEVYREALRLASQGAREITLLGQNVNAYHGAAMDGETWNLAKLVRQIAEIDGVERIRYTTSHPRDMDDELIAAHGEVEALMPFIHLPVQSGSDRILKAMNRKHKAEDYLRLIEKFRAARPDIQFSSDFIVGFPGETDQDFEDTMNLVREVGYAQCYSFIYSPRPGTPAANQEDLVPAEMKNERLQRLQALINQQQDDFNQQCVGLTMPVLFEKQGKREGQVIGRSPYMQAVHIDNGINYLDKIVEVEIKESFANSLRGEIAGENAKVRA